MNDKHTTLLKKELSINVTNYQSNNLTNSDAHSQKNLLLTLEQKKIQGYGQEIFIKLTDTLDPLVLLTCTITKSDYEHLQSSQNLLGDLNSFPLYFCQLIEKYENTKLQISSRFVLVLRTETALQSYENNSSSLGIGTNIVTFEIVEVTEFKSLCHLSLKLSPASLQSKIVYLSDSIKAQELKHRNENDNTSQQISSMSNKIKSLQENLSSKELYIETLKQDFYEKTAQESKKNAEILSTVNDNNIKEKLDIERKAAAERRNIEKDFKNKLSASENKNAALYRKNCELVNAKKEAQKSLKDLMCTLKTKEEEIKEIREELKQSCQQQEDTRRDYSAKVNELADRDNELVSLNERLKKFCDLNRSLEDKNNHLRQQYENQREELLPLREKIQRREQSIEKLFRDVQKKDNTIHNLRKKINEIDRDLEDYAVDNNGLRKEIEAISRELIAVNEDNSDLKSHKNSLENQMSLLKENVEQQNLKIQELEKTNMSNQCIISVLTKQLNNGSTTEGKKFSPNGYISRPLTSDCNPIMTTSTPLAALPGHSNLRTAHFETPPSCVASHISKVREEPCKRVQLEDNKENDKGLPAQYLEPKKHPVKGNGPPQRPGGLLRKNALQPSDPNCGRGKKKSGVSNYFKN